MPSASQAFGQTLVTEMHGELYEPVPHKDLQLAAYIA